MHKANEIFWQYVNSHWAEYLDDTILEVGSYDINGSVKTICSSISKEYIGVDWRPGPNVDVVSLAHNMVFDHKFKAVLSASMLEHDPYYEKSIITMCRLVRSDGFLALSWGGALNAKHFCAEAPDGKFHALPVGKVLDILIQEGFTVVVLVYDKNIHNLQGVSYKFPDHANPKSGLGEVNLIAMPHFVSPLWIDELVSEDDV